MPIERPNYTQFPNLVLDNIDKLSCAEYKVISVICRYTIGFHRDECKLTVPFIQEKTKLSEQGVRNAAKSLESRGWITKNIQRDGTVYSLCFDVDPNSVDPNSVDPNSVDPNSVDPNSVDPDPNSVDPDPNSVDPEQPSNSVALQAPDSLKKDLKKKDLKKDFFKGEQTNTNTSDEQKEPEPPIFHNRTEPNPVQSNLVEPKPTGQDSYSAALRFSSKKEIHPTERCDRAFTPEPWGFYSNPDAGFLEFLIKNHLCRVDHYQHYPRITKFQAKAWLLEAQFSEKRRGLALIKWEEYQASLQEAAESEQLRQTAEIIPITATIPATPPDNSTVSLIARLTVKARMPTQKAQAKAEALANGIPLEAIGLSGEAAS